jgi:predicted transcriptional regulator
MRISEAESRVMEAVWASGPEGLAAEAILAATGAEQGWTESTVRTLIHRLIRKGALESRRRAGGVTYAPKVSREDWVTTESQGLLDRLFGGDVAALVAHVSRERPLPPADVERLRRLVAELDAEEDDD